MFDQMEVTSLLIIGAVGFYFLGFLFRNQIYIRLLVAFGSFLYIIYYATVGTDPLWDAMIGSFMIATASLQGVVLLYWSKLPAAVPKKAQHIYDVIGSIEPGLFRRLYKIATVSTPGETTVLVREGQRAEQLWFLVQGTVHLKRKGSETAVLSQPGFIGEIAWLSGTTASATVIVQPGSELLRWDVDDLYRAAWRSERLQMALEALIAQDLARKLARSHPIKQVDLADWDNA